MVISTDLNILHSFWYKKYIKHVHFLNFLILPSPLICDLPLVWHVFHNIVVFTLGLYATYERKHVAFGFLNLANISWDNEWIKKMYLYTIEFYWAIKKNEILLFADKWMELFLILKVTYDSIYKKFYK
jgi:hypothetical protein